MTKTRTFVDIFAKLCIVWRDLISTENKWKIGFEYEILIIKGLGYIPGTNTDIAAIANDGAVVLTPAFRVSIANPFMTAFFVGQVSTIVVMIANFFHRNALFVRTFELVGQTGQRPSSAQRVVILIASIAALVLTVAYLPKRNTPLVEALKLSAQIALKVLTHGLQFVGSVPAVVVAVAQEVWSQADGVIALEERFLTEAAVRETSRTIGFIGNVFTIFVAIADQLLWNAMTTSTLELILFAVVIETLLLIGAIVAVVVVIAPPSGRNAFLVPALELTFRALPV